MAVQPFLKFKTSSLTTISLQDCTSSIVHISAQGVQKSDSLHLLFQTSSIHEAIPFYHLLQYLTYSFLKKFSFVLK